MAGGCAMRALAIGIVVAVAWLLAPRLTVEAHDDATGVLIGGCAVPNGAGRVALDYRHSIYGRAGREEFEASPAGLALVRLSSPAEAVLEYYARPEPVRRVEGGFEIRVDDPPIPRLRLLASAIGERTLVCGDVRLPLFAREPAGTRVSLTARWRPRLLTWLRGKGHQRSFASNRGDEDARTKLRWQEQASLGTPLRGARHLLGAAKPASFVTSGP